jgi:ferrous iron transport protein B
MSQKDHRTIKYEDPVELSIEIALERIEAMLKADYAFSKRAIGLLMLQRDSDIEALVRETEPDSFDKIMDLVQKTEKHHNHPLDFVITRWRQLEVSDIVKHVTQPVERTKTSFRERLSQVTMNPLTGIPILLLVLYWGLYKFVGEFGAGTVVDFLERVVFTKHVNPFISKLVESAMPWTVLRDLLIGDYGLITLGIRYAVGIVLPIVAVFFIAFSVIEDSGYLPRLAMLIDRVFKRIGLSGRAVIPMVLGFGCDTMATMVTRTLPTKRERLIATMLLALAVPCSAQLGVIMALLHGRRLALLIWAGVISLVFLFVGHLTAKILPGERPTFYMEVPPLRFPKVSNVLVKTYSRVRWYFKEILPLFIFASLLIWVGQITRLFDLAVAVLKAPVKLIGLPPEAARIFLFGFFRRDYGAAGLYDLNKTGILSGVQLVVACVALTLFLPCIAQLLMNVKERGIKTGLAISLFVLVFSFSVAFVVNLLLSSSGIVL